MMYMQTYIYNLCVCLCVWPSMREGAPRNIPQAKKNTHRYAQFGWKAVVLDGFTRMRSHVSAFFSGFSRVHMLCGVPKWAGPFSETTISVGKALPNFLNAST